MEQGLVQIDETNKAAEQKNILDKNVVHRAKNSRCSNNKTLRKRKIEDKRKYK